MYVYVCKCKCMYMYVNVYVCICDVCIFYICKVFFHYFNFFFLGWLFVNSFIYIYIYTYLPFNSYFQYIFLCTHTNIHACMYTYI